jgi:hypothetical protein
MHQRARQVHQPAAPQHAIGDLEDMQADRVAARRVIVPDKALGLQRPQDIVRGPAMEPGGARDLARVQRPLRGMQCAQHLGGRDHRAHRLARTALIAGPEVIRTASRAGGIRLPRANSFCLEAGGWIRCQR